MSLRLLQIQHRPPAAVLAHWQKILEAKGAYSFFQTPLWSDLLCRCLPQARPAHHWLVFSDGVEAVFPILAMRKRWGVVKLESMPWSTYGGLVSKEQVTPAHEGLAAQAILGYLTPCIQITGYPAAEAQSTAPTHPAAEKTTHVARLGEEALLWGAIQPRTRSILRKAESAGLRAWGSNCVEEIQQAEALYRQACERWEGIATVPASFFDTLVGVPCDQARAWLAGQDEPVSMAVILYGKNEVQYFLGANGPEAAALHSAKWLLWHIMTDAAKRGFRWFNFGASGGLEGVAQFKRHLGGTPIQYSQTSYWHPLWQRIKG